MIYPGGQDEMHSRLPDCVFESSRLIAGSVRNPWDWYVSLWGYGCDGRGSLRSMLAGPRRLTGHGYRKDPFAGFRGLIRELGRNRKFWAEVYSDSSSPELFRRWLQALLDSPINKNIKGGNYIHSSLSGFAGLYSYRYCFLFHRTTEHLFDGSLKSRSDLIEADRKHNAVEFVIRMENITEDLIAMLRRSGTSFKPDFIDTVRAMDRTNASSRKSDFSFYYDRQTQELVRKKDLLILNKYGYSPPIENDR